MQVNGSFVMMEGQLTNEEIRAKALHLSKLASQASGDVNGLVKDAMKSNPNYTIVNREIVSR